MVASSTQQRPRSRRRRTTGIEELDLSFVLAPRQNLFFVELVEALCAEARSLGAPASVNVGNFPPPGARTVYVLVPPHEYFTLMHGRVGPPPQALKRSIFICAEQPGSSFFESNVMLAQRAGAVFDINRYAVAAFARQGVAAQHLQLGWTQRWDHLRERERDIDVLFMGCVSDRRAHALATYSRSLARRRVRLLLSDNSRPNWTQSQSFCSDAEKWDLLGRSKVILNIHQDDAPYFEWLRVVQAMSNGAVVVSEHSADFAPLVAGQHLQMGDVSSLHLLTALLLDDGDLWWRTQTAAYEKLRQELPLRAGVEKLVSAALDIADRAVVPDSTAPFFTQPAPDPARIGIFSEPKRPPSPARGNHNAAMIRRALKDLHLELRELRRSQEQLRLEMTSPGESRELELVCRTGAYPASVPRVSVLTALYNHSEQVVGALESACRSNEVEFELIVVDDGSSDTSLLKVLEFFEHHPALSGLLLRHPVNRGLARTRNAALQWARGEFCFVLDADNEVYPHCLIRLAQALDENPQAAFAYGTLERFSGNQSLGLMNILPWEPSRLRMGNYIDAMAMIRTSVVRDRLRGYRVDRRLHGWEDFDLWCRVASAGYEAVHVPEVLARYRVAQHSMLSLTNMSATDAFSLIIESNPELMAGMEPPE